MLEAIDFSQWGYLVRDLKKLQMWNRSHQLTLAVYQVTTTFPKEELYGLTSQIRRASASIPANIAEGCGRHTVADFARFLHIAAGSASELQYHILLAHDLGFIKSSDYECLSGAVEEIKRMLTSYAKKLSADG